MKSVSEAMRDYLLTHPYDVGDPTARTYWICCIVPMPRHTKLTLPKSRPALELLKTLPLDDNNAVFNLTCRLCTAYEQKGFLDGLQFGAELILRLTDE